MPDPVTYFLAMIKAALLSTGGLSNLPSLHADLLARGWATDGQFAQALVVGQVSPGPNGLWVVSLGYLVAGWWGALLALLAASLPPMLIVPIDSLYRRYGDLPAVDGFVRGLGLAVTGLFPVVLIEVLHGYGLDARTAAIGGVAALAAFRKVPNVLVVAAGALVGVLAYQ